MRHIDNNRIKGKEPLGWLWSDSAPVVIYGASTLAETISPPKTPKRKSPAVLRWFQDFGVRTGKWAVWPKREIRRKRKKTPQSEWCLNINFYLISDVSMAHSSSANMSFSKVLTLLEGFTTEKWSIKLCAWITALHPWDKLLNNTSHLLGNCSTRWELFY